MKNRIVLKALLLSLVFVFIFVFSSCSAIFSFSGSYSPQNITGINYNNFTNSSSDILITSDAMYYSKHTLDFSFYEMTQNGSEKMFSHGYSGDFFLANDKLYLSSDNDFIEYDTVSNTKSVLITFNEGKYISSYFIMDGTVYLNVYSNVYETEFIGELYTYSIDNGGLELVSTDVVSIGVINNRPVYMEQVDGICTVYEYNAKSSRSDAIGSFEHSSMMYFDRFVNFTATCIVICNGNYLTVYDLESKSVEKRSVNLNISTAIAYDKYLYITTVDDAVYRYCIKTQELEKICSFSRADSLRIFVTSDTDVYVIADIGDVRLYHPDGTYEQVTSKSTGGVSKNAFD